MKGSPAVVNVPFYDKRNGNPLSVIVAVSIEGVQAVIIQDEINNAESSFRLLKMIYYLK